MDYKKLRLGGAKASVVDLVKDEGKLVYARIAGQDMMVRSISSLIMQGQTKNGDHYLELENDHIGVFRGGTKRLITPISEGYVDCILYQQGIEPTQTMEYLFEVGNDGGFKSFQNFLQLLPIPRLIRTERGEIREKNILQELKDMSIVSKLYTAIGDKTIWRIEKDQLQKDEYQILRDIIVDTLKSEGYEEKEPDALDTAELKKHNLEGIPPLYTTDGYDTKKVHAKWFSPGMTWYLCELDPQTGDAFGYVKNEAQEYCSEWTYFNVMELMDMQNQTFKNGAYVDRDLYLSDDIYIYQSRKGTVVGTLRELENIKKNVVDISEDMAA